MSKPLEWSEEKNARLKRERGFGFEDIVASIEAGGVLDDIINPSLDYPRQRALVIELDSYAIFVPYVEEGDYLFLKTAFPSRKLTKRYLGEQQP